MLKTTFYLPFFSQIDYSSSPSKLDEPLLGLPDEFRGLRFLELHVVYKWHTPKIFVPNLCKFHMEKKGKHELLGSITLNGENANEKLLKSILTYVMQDDLMYPMLTIEDTLMFSAEFRLPSTLSKSNNKARVETLINQLGLRFALKMVIGDEVHRGVSGGERRRVWIGMDITHDPIVLFLDEPTSGLDSTPAFMVVIVLKKIAQSDSVVVMSIHQPSSRTVALLNRVMFLSRGRLCIAGLQRSFRVFWEFGHPIPESDNRVEFTLDLIHKMEGSDDGRGIEELVKLNS